MTCLAGSLAAYLCRRLRHVRGSNRVRRTVDLIDGKEEGVGLVPRAVKKFGAMARARVGLLADTPANRLVADKVVRQLLDEESVRFADRPRIAPFVVASLFVPLRSEVEAQDMLRTPFVRERRDRFEGRRRPRRRGVDPHRPSTTWETEEDVLTTPGPGSGSPSRTQPEPSGPLAQEVMGAGPVPIEGASE